MYLYHGDMLSHEFLLLHASFSALQEYSSLQPHHQPQDLMKPPPRPIMIMGEAQEDNDNERNNNSNSSMEHFLLSNHNSNQSTSPTGGFDKLMSFADVMHFADFGPKLALNHHHMAAAANGVEDPVYFLKFPVLSSDQISNNNNNRIEEVPQMIRFDDYVDVAAATGEGGGANTTTASVTEGATVLPLPAAKNNNGNKRKRAPRSVKTSEEVESQRMTHIAVERNRRKQMNEHLRVLRSLMPASYVQRGDQASIIGGAIELVRELEQLLQCLESQKRRRIYGEPGPPPPLQQHIGAGVDNNNNNNNSIHHHQLQVQPSSSSFFPAADLRDPLLLQTGGNDDDETAALVSFDVSSGGLIVREETAENKSCLADVEVKVLGFDAMIKVLSKRRPGQLIVAIAALEDLRLNILHTNITTIEQTVLYSFNVKVESEGRFTAEEIASSVQRIFTFIHANSGGVLQ